MIRKIAVFVALSSCLTVANANETLKLTQTLEGATRVQMMELAGKHFDNMDIDKDGVLSPTEVRWSIDGTGPKGGKHTEADHANPNFDDHGHDEFIHAGLDHSHATDND